MAVELFSPSQLDEIRARTSLVEIVGRRVQLKRHGRQWRGCCPFHAERRPSFYLYQDHYHCFGCGAHGDVIRFVMETEGVGFIDAATQLAAAGGVDADVHRSVDTSASAPLRAPDPEIERMRRYAHRLFLEAQASLAGTPAAAYLLHRGIDLAALGRQPRALRYHPGLPHRPSGRTFPAMIAAITDAAGVHVATHRTWLQQDRSGVWIKARVEDAKMTLGAFAGGTIRLWRGASGKPLRDAPDDDVVVIGEGIETCLSIAIACPELRVLAAVSLGNMGSITLPPQIRRVILAADNDLKPSARIAFQRVVERHLDAGRDVRIARASVGKDFNDTLCAWRRAA